MQNGVTFQTVAVSVMFCGKFTNIIWISKRKFGEL